MYMYKILCIHKCKLPPCQQKFLPKNHELAKSIKSLAGRPHPVQQGKQLSKSLKTKRQQVF